MMGLGEKSWQSFPMMTAMDFIRSYEPNYVSPEDYVNERLSGLNMPAAKVAKLKDQLRHQYMSEYMQNFRSKFKEVLQTKDLPSQFSTVPSQCNLD